MLMLLLSLSLDEIDVEELLFKDDVIDTTRN